ncbi:hypothetical protein AZH11_27440 [Pseudomonas simiae]|nr:hypothetical protein AZH11_27440 [Pseudomonas simiae]
MELMEAGEPLFQQAVDALRRYNDAEKVDAHAKDLERLQRDTQPLFPAINEYQRCALGGPPEIRL